MMFYSHIRSLFKHFLVSRHRETKKCLNIVLKVLRFTYIEATWHHILVFQPLHFSISFNIPGQTAESFITGSIANIFLGKFSTKSGMTDQIKETIMGEGACSNIFSFLQRGVICFHQKIEPTSSKFNWKQISRNYLKFRKMSGVASIFSSVFSEKLSTASRNAAKINNPVRQNLDFEFSKLNLQTYYVGQEATKVRTYNKVDWIRFYRLRFDVN